MAPQPTVSRDLHHDPPPVGSVTLDLFEIPVPHLPQDISYIMQSYFSWAFSSPMAMCHALEYSFRYILLVSIAFICPMRACFERFDLSQWVSNSY